MISGRGVGSDLWKRASTRWGRLDRGWQAVVLGLAVVGIHWLLQAV